MAEIKPELMEAILSSPNWTMANATNARLFGRSELFLPKPPPPRPALVVPVDLEALYQPNQQTERYVSLPLDLGGPAGDDGQVPPFSAPKPRPSGVHLHWALPDGLLRGEMRDDEDAPIDLRALPDRWLVLRMLGMRNTHRLALRGWVVCSEQGRVYDLKDYPNGPAKGDGDQLAPDQLTAMIGGSPSWTAGYDASRNRFAFHDPLEGVNVNAVMTGLASYVVIGWWSERGHDPLSASLSPYSVARILPELGWSAAAAPKVALDVERFPLEAEPKTMAPVAELFDTPRVVTPPFSGTSTTAAVAVDARRFAQPVDISAQLKLGASQQALLAGFAEYKPDLVAVRPMRTPYDTLMHGAVYGVPIRGGVSKDAAPDARDIKLSMAPTIDRLIAAQAARVMTIQDRNGREYVESLLTAVASGSIARLGERDGVIALDEAEHSDGFEAFQGPDIYEDVVAERGPEDLRAGRGRRSTLAAQASPPPLMADVIWTGRPAGQTVGRMTATLDALRLRANHEGLRKYLDPDLRSARPLTRRVQRPGPRYHRPLPPVIGLRNFGRPNRFNHDGRFDDEGRLTCRWTHELATGFGDIYEAADYLPPLSGRQIPAQAERLLRNAFLFDPYLMQWAFAAISEVVPEAVVGPVQNRLRGEMALRYGADGVYDGIAPIVRGDDGLADTARIAISEELRRFSIIEGRDPSPVAVTSWRQPWAPVWLEWEVTLEPGEDLAGWLLGELEFAGASELTGQALTLRGRAPITSGLARSYQATIQSYLVAESQRDAKNAGEIDDDDQDSLATLAAFLGTADLGSVTLDRISDVWLALESGPDGRVLPVPDRVSGALSSAGLPRLIASGQLRLARARLIDCFGRFRDLNVAGITLPAALESKDQQGRPAMQLPPRLALPARLMWRFVDPADATPIPREAQLDQGDPSRMISPISGYILPDFMDESLEFFDNSGAPLGELLHDPVSGAVIWEGAVGREGPAATLPEEGLSDTARLCGRIASGMVDADIAQRAAPETADKESPLSAFMRAVDTTMWGVDGSLTSSGAGMAGLIGRPVAVVSAVISLDIPTDLAATGAFGDAPSADAIRDHLIAHAVYDAVKSRAFDVRLGSFAKGHDGLYGYFIGDDFSRFHLIDKEIGQAARSNQFGLGYRSLLGNVSVGLGAAGLAVPDPIDCPYISASEALSLHSGQRLRLTLLMHPTARVHATTGFLPRKSLELLRDWVAPGLDRIAPSARVGPVLIDPDKVRLPRIAAFGAEQEWIRRDSPITWRNDPILSATQAALLPEGRVSVQEGYIRIAPAPSEQEEPQ